jgi:hypothetical protein
MPVGTKAPIDQKMLKHWCLLREFSRRLDKAVGQVDSRGGGRPESFKDPRRRLSQNDYLCLLLFGMFNPVVDSMRGLCKASNLKRVREQVCSHRVSLGSFSEAQAVVDAALLEKVFMDLVAEELSCKAVVEDCALQSYRQTLTLVDGTLWEALPRMNWAQWRTQNGTQRAVKLELKFNLLDDRPSGARIGAGRTCERTLLRAQLVPGEFYVADRYYGKDYKLLADIEAHQSFYIIRLDDDALLRVEQQLELSKEDRHNHVIEDCLVYLGYRSQGPVRRVVTVVADDGQEIMLVTNKPAEELSAQLIAKIYRYRWQIELFFKWLKSILGCRHWFAESAQGVAIQIYIALIAALLLTRYCGKKPNKRQMELLQFYFMGYASLEELQQMLPALAQKPRKS